MKKNFVNMSGHEVVLDFLTVDGKINVVKFTLKYFRLDFKLSIHDIQQHKHLHKPNSKIYKQLPNQ